MARCRQLGVAPGLKDWKCLFHSSVRRNMNEGLSGLGDFNAALRANFSRRLGRDLNGTVRIDELLGMFCLDFTYALWELINFGTSY